MWSTAILNNLSFATKRKIYTHKFKLQDPTRYQTYKQLLSSPNASVEFITPYPNEGFRYHTLSILAYGCDCRVHHIYHHRSLYRFLQPWYASAEGLSSFFVEMTCTSFELGHERASFTNNVGDNKVRKMRHEWDIHTFDPSPKFEGIFVGLVASSQMELAAKV